jgi:hypothetical protein
MSFNGLGTFRQGQWQQFRKFVLNERRDVLARVAVIQAELRRIGFMRVDYERTTAPDGSSTVSEKRESFTVVPENSSLAKLVASYVACGGNPLDISMFMHPDSTFSSDQQSAPAYPSDGVVSPVEQPPSFGGGVFQQGAPSVQGYATWVRGGGRRQFDDADMVNLQNLSRRWASKEIAYKRDNIEARILKLCDLREQLLIELDDIVRAVGDAVNGLPTTFDSARYDPQLTVAQAVAIVDSIWYETDENGRADFNTQSNNLGGYPNLTDDLAGGIQSNTAV